MLTKQSGAIRRFVQPAHVSVGEIALDRVLTGNRLMVHPHWDAANPNVWRLAAFHIRQA